MWYRLMSMVLRCLRKMGKLVSAVCCALYVHRFVVQLTPQHMDVCVSVSSKLQDDKRGKGKLSAMRCPRFSQVGCAADCWWQGSTIPRRMAGWPGFPTQHL